jgi:hypothetical protein
MGVFLIYILQLVAVFVIMVWRDLESYARWCLGQGELVQARYCKDSVPLLDVPMGRRPNRKCWPIPGSGFVFLLLRAVIFFSNGYKKILLSTPLGSIQMKTQASISRLSASKNLSGKEGVRLHRETKTGSKVSVLEDESI